MGQVGIPDIICCYKGLFVAIETKAPGKRANLTDNQKRIMENIRDADGFAFVVDDPSELGVLFNSIDAYKKLNL
jgi:penicillin-binding protein-related factor A (putative recombinase)